MNHIDLIAQGYGEGEERGKILKIQKMQKIRRYEDTKVLKYQDTKILKRRLSAKRRQPPPTTTN